MKYKYIYGRLGKEISRIRKEKNISQEDLAFNCYIDRSYLAEIEEGKANPSLKVLCKIAEGLKIKSFFLLIPQSIKGRDFCSSMGRIDTGDYPNRK
jgi:transcriptional regulator with XRE-family HTH domain